MKRTLITLAVAAALSACGGSEPTLTKAEQEACDRSLERFESAIRSGNILINMGQVAEAEAKLRQAQILQGEAEKACKVPAEDRATPQIQIPAP